jgi:GxxExxY protein
MKGMTENEIAKKIVNTAYIIHTELGAGLFESVYKEILYMELSKSGLSVAKQKEVPVI